MQENGINVIHIESRKSKKFDSEYEIFVNLESNQKKNVVMPALVKSLKRQLSYVRIDSDTNRNLELSPTTETFAINEAFNEEVFDGNDLSPGETQIRPSRLLQDIQLLNLMTLIS